MSVVQQALPILLTALGGKMGVKIEVMGDAAYTDGETIRIPALPIEGSPSLRTRAYGYGGHEASHVRNTDMRAFTEFARKGEFAKHILNIVEDIRIERALIAEFPGMAKVLAELVADIVATQPKSFGPPSLQDPPEAILAAWLLITRRYRVLKQDALAKADAESEAVFLATFPAAFRLKLEALLAGLPYMDGGKPATAEAVKVAQAILDLIQHEAKKPDPNPKQGCSQGEQQQGQQGEQDQSGGNSGKGNGSQSSGDKQDGQGQTSGGEGKQGDQKQNGASGSSNKGADKEKGEQKGQGGQTQGQSDQATGGSGAGESSQEPDGSALRKLASKGAGADGVPKELATELSDAVRDGLQKEAAKVGGRVSTLRWTSKVGGVGDERRARNLSGPMRQRLRMLVEDQARVRPRAVRAGNRLMTNRLTRAAMGDSRVFRTQEEARATNAAMHLLLDCSGSMASSAVEVGVAALALAEAVDTMRDVNLGVSGFGGDNLIAMLKHGERMNALTRSRIQGHAGGGTPLAEALVTVGGVLLNQEENRKVLVILTDGAPSGGPTDSADIIKRLRAQGVIVLGIGLGVGTGSFMPQIFGSDHEVIASADEMREAIFRMTQRAISR